MIAELRDHRDSIERALRATVLESMGSIVLIGGIPMTVEGEGKHRTRYTLASSLTATRFTHDSAERHVEALQAEGHPATSVHWRTQAYSELKSLTRALSRVDG